jgi:hypothetical protein
MKINNLIVLSMVIVTTIISSCAYKENSKIDLVSDTFPEAQTELETVLEEIYNDAMTANVEGLGTSHLISPKFTKFGPRNFNRQTADETNKSEASFFTSISDLKVELKDVKVDVFGNVAITTFYPHFSFVKDDKLIEGSTRQTLVFLKTESGWKIIHEHGTPKKCFTN